MVQHISFNSEGLEDLDLPLLVPIVESSISLLSSSSKILTIFVGFGFGVLVTEGVKVTFSPWPKISPPTLAEELQILP